MVRQPDHLKELGILEEKLKDVEARKWDSWGCKVCLSHFINWKTFLQDLQAQGSNLPLQCQSYYREELCDTDTGKFFKNVSFSIRMEDKEAFTCKTYLLHGISVGSGLVLKENWVDEKVEEWWNDCRKTGRQGTRFHEHRQETQEGPRHWVLLPSSLYLL